MTSVLLFTLVGTSILNVSTQSMTMGKRSDFSYTAYNLAKNHLETLRAMPFGSLASAAETSTRLNANGVPDGNGDYIRTTAVTPNYTGDPNLVQISVSVDYILRGQQSAQPTQLTSVLFQYG